MKFHTAALRFGPGALALAGAIALATSASAQTNSIPFDTPTVVNGVEAVCTGVGVSEEDAARWAKYPVKVVLAGKEGQFLGGATVTVSKAGNALVSVTCGGPWTLFRLAPGKYGVSASLGGETRNATVDAPAAGQGRVILRFLNQGGMISPQHTPSPQ